MIPTYNSEFSRLLQNSSQYLDNFNDRHSEINNSQDLVHLQKMRDCNVDAAYENKALNAALKILNCVREINLVFTTMALGSYSCRAISSIGHIFQSSWLCKIMFLDILSPLPTTGISRCIGIVWSISKVYEILSTIVSKYVDAKSSLHCQIKFYNRDVDHINKCLTYLEEHRNDEELNNLLLPYIGQFAELFKSPNITNIGYFVGTVEQQVEEVLTNDGPDNIHPNVSLFSVSPETRKDKKWVMTNAYFLTKKINSYCAEEKRIANENKDSWKSLVFQLCLDIFLGVGIFASSCPLIIIGFSIAASIRTIQNSVQGNRTVTAYGETTNLHNIALKNAFVLNDFEKHVSNKRNREYLSATRSRLYNTLTIVNPFEESGDLPEGIEAPSGSSLSE